MDRGAVWAAAGYLVTFGIPASRPETGYGYIKQGAPLDPAGTGFKASRFIEKPDASQSRAFLAEGGYYWNSGIFLFRRDALLEALQLYLPEVYRGLATIEPGMADPDLLAEVYRESPNISLDHGIMEHAARVAVVPVDMGWNDVGTWGALQEIFPRDPQGNVLQGRTLDRGSKGCTFFAQDRLVATIGLEKVIVVDTQDATLVCHRDRVQEVKELVAELQRREMAEVGAASHGAAALGALHRDGRGPGVQGQADRGGARRPPQPAKAPATGRTLGGGAGHRHGDHRLGHHSGAQQPERLHPRQNRTPPGKPEEPAPAPHRSADRPLSRRGRYSAPGGRLPPQLAPDPEHIRSHPRNPSRQAPAAITPPPLFVDQTIPRRNPKPSGFYSMKSPAGGLQCQKSTEEMQE